MILYHPFIGWRYHERGSDKGIFFLSPFDARLMYLHFTGVSLRRTIVVHDILFRTVEYKIDRDYEGYYSESIVEVR